MWVCHGGPDFTFLLQHFAVEQMESTKLDFELVNFVRLPIIEVRESMCVCVVCVRGCVFVCACMCVRVCVWCGCDV